MFQINYGLQPNSKKEGIKMESKKYEVTVLEKKGSCDSATFEKMAQNGDINSEKVTENVGKVINLTGYALCHITAGDKEFDMNYYATDEGILSTGSEVFKNSVEEYYDDVKTFKIVSINSFCVGSS